MQVLEGALFASFHHLPASALHWKYLLTPVRQAGNVDRPLVEVQGSRPGLTLGLGEVAFFEFREQRH